MSGLDQERRAQVAYTVKHDGPFKDERGRSRAILASALAMRGVQIPDAALTRVLRELADEGAILRDLVDKQTFTIEAGDVSAYDDPFEGAPAPLPGDVPVVVAPTRGRRGGRSLDTALNAIEKLTLPEKLMLVGQLADDCAGEVDDVYGRLRAVLGNI